MHRDQWEAGRLIQEAREARGITKRAAAKMAGISESWWRRIEFGRRSATSDEEIRPTAETMATAARIVGLSPRRILAIGGYAETPDESVLLRDEISSLLDRIDDEQLPTVKTFLEGLYAATSD